MSNRSRYIIGIDLGTTNCAAAYVDTKGRERPSADIKPFEIPQLVAPGESAPKSMLPSFVYLCGPHELPAGATDLPWSKGEDRLVGEFARIQGSRIPAHLVSSAKSWLCHAGVDREADILPWGAPADARRISPVEASAAYLRHIRDAWNHRFAATDESSRLERQEVVLTVPASFDEAARELTLAAARSAGIEKPVLLEEPQAAFYCWIVSHQSGWQKEVRAGELILVCDVGGGTTDFSLITVVETPTGPGFRRVAVGDHLMLGGDNIDLALAHRVEQSLAGVRLDADQWSALRQACRSAKEKLLGDSGLARWPVSIAGRGSRIIGGSLQSELSAEDVSKIALDGFFPRTHAAEEPGKGSKLGLQEFGLPFVSDPAVTKHLASFLRKHRAEAILPEGYAPDDRPARPDAILFNGGALTPRVIRDRIVDVIASWFPNEQGEGTPPRVLSNDSLDLAVALGAAYYGVVRRGGGIRIGGGTARSFYLGFESATNERPWLCLIPRDAKEGEEVSIEEPALELLTGRPIMFPLASSSVRPQDRPGDLAAGDPDSIRELPPLQGEMRVGRKAKAERVPVKLEARVSEIGTVEVWCRSRTDERRWRLEIQLRGQASRPLSVAPGTSPSRDGLVIEQSEIDAGISAIKDAFAAPAGSEGPTPDRLVKRLEEALDAVRDSWPPSALRALWDPLNEVAELRFKSPRHESRWLNLAGYCLRPGSGYPLDRTRIKALWPVFHQNVKHVKDAQCRVEWWVLWRRVSSGLSRAHHEEIHRRLGPLLAPSKAGGKKSTWPKAEPHEVAEMWRSLASLEHLSTAVKEASGDALSRDSARSKTDSYMLWCLGRLGCRVPLFGPANTVVSRSKAETWLRTLLAREPSGDRERADLIFAITALARMSGDRVRDIDEGLRAEVIDRLTALGASEQERLPVLEFHELETAQESRALGDSLPVGLRLVGESAPAEAGS